MEYPEIILAQQVIAGCKAKGVRKIVLSPGSRNAPLTGGFTSDSFFECYSIVDERCAGFFALGMARESGEMVAVVCTSGSALLNYAPAVSEAYYSNVPLVVISADRPSNKIDIGDGQTIHQVGALSNHTGYDANLSDRDEDFDFNERELNEAFNRCRTMSLPVHINAPFEEPLYRMVGQSVCFQNVDMQEVKDEDEQEMREFWQAWNGCEKKLVLVGFMKAGSVEERVVKELKEDGGVLVMLENIGNVRDESHIDMIDTFLTGIMVNEGLSREFAPEMVVSIGNMIVSKKIKQFLRANKPKYHYCVDEYVGYDSFFCLKHHFKMSFNEFWKKGEGMRKVSGSDYKAKWRKYFLEIIEERESFFENLPYSDMMVYREIFERLPEGLNMQISNSAPIRYSNLFKMKEGVEYYSNRGVSGIDGCTSTAIGASVVSEKRTIFLTGDLGFLYNSNALWCAYTPKNFKIILVNNDGGGIFRFLHPKTEGANFAKYFETKHGLNAENLAKMYGWGYEMVKDKGKLIERIQKYMRKEESERPEIMEIFTPSEVNDKVYKEYFLRLEGM